MLAAGKKHPAPLKVDQGSKDNFLCGDVNQLTPDALTKACEAAGQPLEYNLREGYDHSYYFISSFMAEHVGWHARHLQG